MTKYYEKEIVKNGRDDDDVDDEYDDDDGTIM
jgi:hypothetical protein